jgi:histidinol-phosphate aminotransferase
VPGKTIEGCVKLASNENNFGPSPKVIEALKKASSTVNQYPYKDVLLRQELGKYCGSYSADNVILGNGSDELIDLILKAFKGPLYTFGPTFASYSIYARMLNEKYSEKPLNADFSFPLSEFLAGAKDAGIIFLCTPNNPTGTILSEEEIAAVLDLGKPTVVDEAYYEYCGKTCLPLLKDYDNLIVTRTLAKAFGLAGLRIGYAVTNPDTVKTLLKVKPPFNVNILAQEAALAALSDVAYMKKMVETTLAERDILYGNITKRFAAVPSYTNFILVNTHPLSAKDFYEKLLAAGFVVRQLGRFPGFSGEYCRITVGTPEQNKKLAAALESI